MSLTLEAMLLVVQQQEDCKRTKVATIFKMYTSTLGFFMLNGSLALYNVQTMPGVTSLCYSPLLVPT